MSRGREKYIECVVLLTSPPDPLASLSNDGDISLMTPRHPIKWQQPDGRTISCEEKLKVLNENLAEIRQMCQDAFEDALLMGCDESQVRGVFAAVIDSLHNPYGCRD